MPILMGTKVTTNKYTSNKWIPKIWDELTLQNVPIDEGEGLLDEHENSNKGNLRNREPGCIYAIEYVNSESSSLFFLL
jgi:hypothetical protein